MEKTIAEEWGWSLRDNYIPNIKEKIKNYFIPMGRVRRRDFVIAYILLVASLLVVASIMIGITNDEQYSFSLPILFFYLWITLVGYATISLSIKRLHDSSHSGWYVLLRFIPLLNLYLLYLLLFDREDGPNEYGSDPRESFNVQYE